MILSATRRPESTRRGHLGLVQKSSRPCENFPLVSLGRLLYDMIGNSLGTIEWA